MRIKKKYRQFLWGVFVIFGIMIGLPFFMAGKSFIDYAKSLTPITILFALAISFVMGVIIERWGKDLMKGWLK